MAKGRKTGAVNELSKLNDQWQHAANEVEREKIWHRMLQIHSEQMFTIGIISGVRHPVVVNNYLHNVPEMGSTISNRPPTLVSTNPILSGFAEVRR